MKELFVQRRLKYFSELQFQRERLSSKRLVRSQYLLHTFASILHFARYGSADARINNDSPFEGALCLAYGKREKELLFADETQKLDLKADLVVLSACQTDKGAQRREGVIGLSRAFLGAGIPSGIATH